MPKLKWKDTRLHSERFSDWFKFFRVLAYFFRFVKNSSRVTKLQGPLTAEEINDVEVMVLPQVQQESYPEEFSRARKEAALLTRSKCYQSLPF